MSFPSLTSEKLVWHRVEAGGLSPSRRNCHTATLFGHYLVIFGGREGDGRRKMVNDIHILDVSPQYKAQLEKLQWTIPQIEGKTQPRMGHSA